MIPMHAINYTMAISKQRKRKELCSSTVSRSNNLKNYYVTRC